MFAVKLRPEEVRQVFAAHGFLAQSQVNQQRQGFTAVGLYGCSVQREVEFSEEVKPEARHS